jgi:hypothetical protein
MDLCDLVRAIVDGDLLTARQWVADARREGIVWEHVERPLTLTGRELTVAAAIAELLAARAGATPPSWTQTVGAEAEPFVLDPGLEKMPRSFAHAKATGAEPLRKRNLIAMADFLDVA